MIVSENTLISSEEFENLLAVTHETIEQDALNRPDHYLSREGRKLEDDIFSIMKNCSVGTGFEGTLEKISGQKFPDIIAKNKFHGVEVKTTTQNHWKSTGNSVFESTRVLNIERIYLFFGKLSDPIGFKYRRYEDCLPEIAVTHSPRYLIDMDLEKGHTIFDKIGISYNDLRCRENPIVPIREHYKKLLKNGDNLWWLDSEEQVQTPGLVVKLWSNLDQEQQKKIISEAMALFPQIFGTSNRTKFNNLPFWLLNTHSTMHPNLRDTFTAGGTRVLSIKGRVYTGIPAIFGRLHDNIGPITLFLKSTDPRYIERYWAQPVNTKDVVSQWLDMVHSYSESSLRGTGLDIRLLKSSLTSPSS